LTTGTGGTALACYLAILEQDTNNNAALAGLAQIEARYVEWIKEVLEQGNEVKAQLFIDRLYQVNPNSLALNDLKTQLAKQIELKTTTKMKLNKYFTEVGKNSKIDIPLEFVSNGVMLKPESELNFEEIGKALISEDLKGYILLIIGHTDNVGSAYKNQFLSEKRTLHLKGRLIAEYGLNSNTLIVEGAGEFFPIASNSTPEGREKNNRVSIHVETKP